MRFSKDNKKSVDRNLERSTLKLENNKSRLMFNETCYTYLYIYLQADESMDN